ncbi:MAG: sulfatase, partial [Acidobacteriota bacterium]|nr:sulfatase [Acidobacteriota bacterium]
MTPALSSTPDGPVRNQPPDEGSRASDLRLWIASLWLLGLFALLGSTACSPDGGASAGPDFGKVFFEGPLIAVPDHNWSGRNEADGWLFRGSATLRYRIARQPQEPLELFFQPTDTASGHRYRVLWDGEEVLAPAAGDGQDLLATVPPEQLVPGDHVLEIERVYGGDRSDHENPLARLGYRLGDDEVLFDAQQIERYRYLGDFLTVGVTGVGRQKFGGLLHDGPGRGETTVHLDAPGYLHLRGENFSTSPATFMLETAGQTHSLEVPAMSDRPLRFALDGGTHRLELQAQGVDEGLFLWAEITVEPRQEEPRQEGSKGADDPVDEASEAAPPPIFLITLDTTRRDALSPYGEDPAITPVLDAFAQQATVYDRAYSVSPWTLPSHASMMTGLYPSHHGAGVSAQFLGAGTPTLASILRRRGYFTAGFSGGKLCSHRYGIGHGFHRFRNPQGFETSGDEMTADLVRFVEEHQRKQLFVFANYFDPHAMYRAPEPFEQRLRLAEHRKHLEGNPIWQRFDQGNPGAWRKIIDLEAPEATPEVLAYMRAAYLSEVAFMDAQLGLFFDRLRGLGLYERALIVLVADHGELLGEGGLFSHAGRLDPELTEIPLLIKWPHQSEGRRVDALASPVDLFETIRAAAGVEVPPENDG